jgi:hypothetical protein
MNFVANNCGLPLGLSRGGPHNSVLMLPELISESRCHIERSETSLDVVQSHSCKDINLRFFASLRMTERLPPSSAAAEDSAKQTASDLPAD